MKVDWYTLWSRWLIPLLIVVATLSVFFPAFDNGFVNWDDDKNLLDNPHYRGLGQAQLLWMWTSHLTGHYIPITWMSLGLDYVLWGMNPLGYHLTNLILHAANAVLFYYLALLLLRMPGKEDEGSLLAAAFAALFFALHPLRVESVVWATETPGRAFRAVLAAGCRGIFARRQTGSLPELLHRMPDTLHTNEASPQTDKMYRAAAAA